jgi:hypothetical protein
MLANRDALCRNNQAKQLNNFVMNVMLFRIQLQPIFQIELHDPNEISDRFIFRQTE